MTEAITILLVDDNQKVRQALEARVAEAGYRVLSAATGPEAVEIAQEHKPDLVLLSHELPGYGGVEVCHRLAQDADTARTPVLITTRLDDKTFKQYADCHSVSGRLPHPYTAAQLIDLIKASTNDSVDHSMARETGRILRHAPGPDEPIQMLVLESDAAVAETVRSAIVRGATGLGLARQRLHLRMAAKPATAGVMLRTTPPHIAIFDASDEAMIKLVDALPADHHAVRVALSRAQNSGGAGLVDINLQLPANDQAVMEAMQQALRILDPTAARDVEALLHEARQAIAHGNPQRAIEQLELVRELEPNHKDLDALWQQASEATHSSAVQGVYAEVDKLIEAGQLTDGFEKLLATRAREESNQQDTVETDARLEDISRMILDRDIDSLLSEADALLADDKPEAAAEKIRDAEALDHTRTDIVEKLDAVNRVMADKQIDRLHLQANQLVEQQRLNEAIAKLEQAASIDSRRMDTSVRLKDLNRMKLDQDVRELQNEARHLVSRRAFSAAMDKLHQALALDPQRADTRSQLEAATISLNETKLQTLYKQADALASRGNPDQAIAKLQEADQIAPGREETRRRIQALEQDHLDQKIDALLDKARDHMQAHRASEAMVCVEQAEHLDARRVDVVELKHAVQEQVAAEQLQARLAEVLSLNGRGLLDEAQRKLREVARSVASDDQTGQKHLKDVREQLTDAEIDRLHAEADELLHRRDLESAVAKLREAEQLDDTRVDTLERLEELSGELRHHQINEILSEVRALIRQDRLNTARKTLLKAHELDPNRAETIQLAADLRDAIVESIRTEVGEPAQAHDAAEHSEGEVFVAEVDEDAEEAFIDTSGDEDWAAGVMTPKSEGSGDTAIRTALVDEESAVQFTDAADQSLDQDSQLSDNESEDPMSTARHEGDDMAFGYHWSVTTELSVPRGTPLPYGMDDSLDTDDLPLRHDVAVFYPSVFGEFPELGLHQLFYKTSGYGNWASANEGWLERHEQKVTSVLRKMYPQGTPVEDLPRYGVLAKGNWSAALEMTPNQKSNQPGPLANDLDFESDWEEFILNINDPWDPDFLEALDFTPPEGIKSFKELRRSEARAHKTARKSLLVKAWDHYAARYYTTTLKICQALCPDVLWGLQGYPATPYMAFAPGSPNAARFTAINDRMAWLWQATDVILPIFTATRRTVESNPEESRKENDRATDRANIEHCLQEVFRVRDTYAPGKPIVSVHGLEYSRIAGGGPLNDLNFQHQFLLPKDLGVEGVMISAHITSHEQVDQLADELDGRLGDAIRQASDASAHERQPTTSDDDDDLEIDLDDIELLASEDAGGGETMQF